MKCRKASLITFLFTLVLSFYASGNEPLLENIQGRTDKINLNGEWQYVVDPYETGYYDYRRKPYEETGSDGFYANKKTTVGGPLIEYQFIPEQTLRVPGDWNSQKDELFYYEGTVWYKKDFKVNKTAGANYVLHFGAVNYESIIYLNGKRLGTHTGGFTSFNFDATALIQDGENVVVVKVDNTRKKEAIPTTNTDWWNYGGITRDVTLVKVTPTYISNYSLQLSAKNTAKLSITCAGAKTNNNSVTVKIPELKFEKSFTTDAEGKINAELTLKKVKMWSPESPKLYEVIFINGEETITDKIGFRTIETKGTEILLNGESIYMKGICIHEENAVRGGRAFSKEDAHMLLGWAKELNCNYVRLAHYPHNEYMVQLADEMGLMVWSEIPVYWTIDWENKATFANAKSQLEEMVSRDKNRASIVIWSIGNETPITDVRNTFMSNLAKHAKQLDPSRLISAALELHYPEGGGQAILEDPLAEHLDIMSFNEYIGWYGDPDVDIATYNFKFAYQKPVLISEFGAGSLQGYHNTKDIIWSEEFQAAFYQEQLKLIDRHSQIRGFTPWILVDFRSPKRLNPVYQKGWNRKGLISNMGVKKQAYSVLQEYYQDKK